MADPERPRKTPPKATVGPSQKLQKVSQSTIDSMKTMGMSKAISKANSGSASAEFVEGAKRMYGNRIKPSTPGPSVTKSASAPAAKGPGPVVAMRGNTPGPGLRASTPAEKARGDAIQKKAAFDKSQAAIKKKGKSFGKNESAM